MNILIIGAGALGGYFGARLADVGADVTFLLREGRARQIARNGLSVHSPTGNTHIAYPQTLSRETLARSPVHYDAILVGCKAYDLDDTMDAFAPGVGLDTAIVPLLNGMAHLSKLGARFSDSNVLGGFCLISAALDDNGTIQHLNDTHALYFGERDGTVSDRVMRLKACFAEARCDAFASDHIVGQMWEKWVQIATAAGMTCLMRGSIGDIVASGGASLALALFDESSAIATDAGYPLSAAATERIRSVVTDARSPVTASMMKDLERGARIEGDHLIGELVRTRDRLRVMQSPDGMRTGSLLDLVLLHLRTYERRQAGAQRVIVR